VFVGHIINNTGVLVSPQPDLLPDIFCMMVRIFRLMLVLLYTVFARVISAPAYFAQPNF